MFDAGEWNDNQEVQELTESLLSTQKRAPDAKQDKGAISRRKRLKRNRQLLEILQTLKSSSAQNPDLPPPLEDVGPPGKQRKVTPDIIPEESSTSNSKSPPPNTGTQLSRQKWRNKMKNKKKNRNKFKPCEEKQKNTVASREEGESRTGGQPGNVKRRGNKEEEETTDKDGGQKKDHRKKTSGDSKCDPVSPKMTAVVKARLEKLKKLLKKEAAGREKDPTTDEDPEDTTGPDDSNLPEEEVTDRSASLRSRMEQRLHSARFRYINEQLYTSDSHQAVQLFQNDPEAFNIYHTGFSQQVQRWPISPITEILKYIKNRPPSLVVADFGCGDAQLACSVRNNVHSFDLVALNDRVTVCDMAQVPLSDETVDIAVFCLSLMGKNLSDFLKEANRVLKMEGVLLVAEVSSRFDDVRQFLSAMSQLGFKCVNKNTENSHFYLFEFSKARLARDASRHAGLQLKPCLYKKR
ncbi:PREDICTED: ribosomal RNA-processing protein 8 [Nanorana parkeri]|uniref:ribosomal RNA-processing protein 8 n=1 Tax=Nanorana parkeri TaxID=125878 RepID=UPI0008542511|nr:PREDICTED: ribosomal RNA-processing protein 8 [Nanorana parkeri]